MTTNFKSFQTLAIAARNSFLESALVVEPEDISTMLLSRNHIV